MVVKYFLDLAHVIRLAGTSLLSCKKKQRIAGVLVHAQSPACQSQKGINALAPVS